MKPICHQCQAGQHPTCSGTAWDFDTDEITLCGCEQKECRS